MPNGVAGGAPRQGQLRRYPLRRQLEIRRWRPALRRAPRAPAATPPLPGLSYLAPHEPAIRAASAPTRFRGSLSNSELSLLMTDRSTAPACPVPWDGLRVGRQRALDRFVQSCG